MGRHHGVRRSEDGREEGHRWKVLRSDLKLRHWEVRRRVRRWEVHRRVRRWDDRARDIHHSWMVGQRGMPAEGLGEGNGDVEQWWR
jgi:hypothetical protein